ncbi:MarR family winged helix-turn-helix transcriptional regulator [Jannaschia ovalis]|uniref:MarR family transcriptional regulator n=1 Tax=Jannaschia ovalis TaxID=3038773 RepID=A0ABY8LEQ9_9RHOB|nr:MarR family transcriptional regulator [Jannaschia sp. GRR-S6-38]WGH79651.1 MarR family transcriptional regulator [Jannaschia sp. GRR-S6-38]
MSLPPEDMICFALYSASQAMQQAYRPLLDMMGLTYPQYLVMSALWTGPETPTVGALGRQLGLDSSTLTPLLKRLEAGGLVTRRRDPKDERLVRIAMTDAGRALQASAADIPRCIAEKTGLTSEEIARLHGELQALAARLRAPD